MLDSVLEAATEKGAHAIEHGLKKICFQVMRGDPVVLHQNTSKRHINAIDEMFCCSHVSH